MLAMIWAQARAGAIGKDGTLPWNVPEDMALFKRLTMGHPVIMGRRTWESLDPRWKPLPGRTNYVVTRNADYRAAGAIVQPSLESAYAAAHELDPELVWLMGGGQLYAYGIDSGIADGAVVTDLEVEVPEATTFSPGIPFTWELIEAQPKIGWLYSERGNVNYRFSVYRRPGSKFGEGVTFLPDAEYNSI